MLLGLTLLLTPEGGAQQVTDSQSNHSQDAAHAGPASKSPALTNADVVKMVKGGLQESTILSVIAATDCDFDVSVDGLLALKTCRHQRQSHGCDAGRRCQETDFCCRHAPAVPQAALIQNSDAMGMSPDVMSQLSPAQRQQMAAAMSQMGGMNGMAGMGGMMGMPEWAP